MHSRPTWDETWMAIAEIVSRRSLCSRDQVGAVVVSAQNRIIDTGYNGPPAGWQTASGTCTKWCERSRTSSLLHPSYDDCPALHAEANALMFSDRRLREGGTIYVSSGTCSACAKLIANSGLKRAVYSPSARIDGAPHRDSSRWYDFLEACGLEVVILELARR